MGDPFTAYREDQFDVYLMFEPTSYGGGSTVAIPLKMASWSWRGNAIQTNGTWLLIDTNYPSNVSGSDAFNNLNTNVHDP